MPWFMSAVVQKIQLHQIAIDRHFEIKNTLQLYIYIEQRFFTFTAFNFEDYSFVFVSSLEFMLHDSL